MANKIQQLHKYRIVAEEPAGDTTYSHNFAAKQWRAVVKEARRFATPLPTGTRVYAKIINQPGAVLTHIHTVTPKDKPKPDKTPADLKQVFGFMDEASRKAWHDSHFPPATEHAMKDIKIEKLPVFNHVIEPLGKEETNGAEMSTQSGEPAEPTTEEKLVEIMYESDKFIKALESETLPDRAIKVAGRGGSHVYVHVRNKNGHLAPVESIAKTVQRQPELFQNQRKIS